MAALDLTVAIKPGVHRPGLKSVGSLRRAVTKYCELTTRVYIGLTGSWHQRHLRHLRHHRSKEILAVE